MMRWLVLFFILTSALPAHAYDMQDFRALPVLADGRIKPLETFARSELMILYGRDTAGGERAIDWLASVLFTPETAEQEKIILIKSTRVQQMLGLAPAPDNLYSYEDVAAAFDANKDALAAILRKPEADRTQFERDVMERYGAVIDYFQLLNSMSVVLPDTAALLGRGPDINQKLIKIIQKKGARMDLYSPIERKWASEAYLLTTLQAVGRSNTLFRVIPMDGWLSPWQAMLRGHSANEAAKTLLPWHELAKAYITHDAALWAQNVAIIQAQDDANSYISDWRLWLEVQYQIFNPLLWLTIFYACTALLLGFAQKHKTIFRAGQILAWVSAAGHAAMVLSRMLILMRPPVSTLYESLLFVSLVVMAASLWWSRTRTNSQWAGPLLAFIILAVAPTYAPQGDTMGVLIAVLNTNFWLATHVVCITTGYATALLAGSAAHLALARDPQKMETHLKWLAVTALFFTATGTLLGGIWADQSWGRFWGWDPKENGALLIVLWLIWTLHGRMTKYMSARGFAAWLAAANIIVALSWFGVNLLSVGLHSYGFTDRAAYDLAAFCGAEVMIITALYIYSRRRAHA